MEKFNTYKFSDDGSQLVAESATQIVIFMRDNGRFTTDELLDEYMQGFADRYRVQTGNSVRCDIESHFVEDLLKFGFIEVVSTPLPSNFI